MGFDPDARSPKGALGLMQVMPDTAVHVSRLTRLAYNGEAWLLDPTNNMAVGQAWLQQLAQTPTVDNSLLRLIVAASGRESAARIWTGGKSVSDPEHHRFGGVSIEGASFPQGSLLLGQHSPEQALLFDLGQGMSRLYLRSFSDALAEYALGHSFEHLLDYVRPWFSPEILTNARSVGPLGFFANSNTWGSKLTAPGVALIGDVAGSADPSGGHGTSLVFRDVRVLSDLLLGQTEWTAAQAEYLALRNAGGDLAAAAHLG